MLTVVVDTSEQVPWTFEEQPGVSGIRIIRASLQTGDYSLLGLETRVSIERKSLDDFAKTVMSERARFYRELGRLRAFEFRCVIVEASVRQIVSQNYRSAVDPKTLLGFVSEIAVRQSVPVYLGGSRAECQILAAGFLHAAEKHLRTGSAGSAGGAVAAGA